MSQVKRTTLFDRIRRAIKAFIGKPTGSIHMGMEIHRCDKCEHKNKPESMVFYICDNPDCKHTPKIEHAKNFKSNEEFGMNNGYSDYWEVERAVPEITADCSYGLTPKDVQVSLAECPVGLFEYNGILGMKTEYMTKIDEGKYIIDAYVVSSGERFCIDKDTKVGPCEVRITG